VNLHGPVRAAEVEGTARLVISLNSWSEGKVAPSVHEIVVLPPKKGAKREPVTDRLIKTLPHPDRQASIGVVRFSSDGTRFMMSGYPSGVVQIWDTKTWKETARIDTPSGLRNTFDYALPTPDWKSVLVHVMNRKVVREEKDGKVNERLQITGRIDVYDTASGKRTRSIALADRGPSMMFLEPGGRFAVVQTQGSFAARTDRPMSTELIELSSGAAKKLLDKHSYPGFAPDGKTAYLAAAKYHPTGEVDSALVKYDLAGARVLKTKEAKGKQVFLSFPTPSPDGKRLFVITGTLAKSRYEDVTLAVLDSETLEEQTRIRSEDKTDTSSITTYDPQFTPDGKTMITRCGGPLIVWDMTTQKIVRTVPIGDLGLMRLLLSPDGKRAVVAGTPRYAIRRSRGEGAEDIPQSRLVLIDLANAKSKPEVLMLPGGVLLGAALSPNGKTVAVGSTGGVHLVDVGARGRK
jgi:WD40 repeat protein